MRALRLGGERGEQLLRLALGFLVTEDRQRKGRLGDEHVARHKLEGHAGRIAGAFIVA